MSGAELSVAIGIAIPLAKAAGKLILKGGIPLIKKGFEVASWFKEHQEKYSSNIEEVGTVKNRLLIAVKILSLKYEQYRDKELSQGQIANLELISTCIVLTEALIKDQESFGIGEWDILRFITPDKQEVKIVKAGNLIKMVESGNTSLTVSETAVDVIHLWEDVRRMNDQIREISSKLTPPKLRPPFKVDVSFNNDLKNHVGRHSEVDSLVEMLKKGNEVCVTGRHKLSVKQAREQQISGSGGIGKTHLTKMIALNIEESPLKERFLHGVIFRVMGKDRDSGDIVRELEYQLTGDNASTLNQSKENIFDSIKNFSILFILDDVWRKEQLTAFHGIIGPKSVFLVTSRFELLDRDNIFNIDALGREDAAELCRRHLIFQNQVPKEESDIILNLIAGYCGGIPQCIIAFSTLIAAKINHDPDLSVLDWVEVHLEKVPCEYGRIQKLTYDFLEELPKGKEFQILLKALSVLPYDEEFDWKLLEVIAAGCGLELDEDLDDCMQKLDFINISCIGGQFTFHDLQLEFIKKLVTEKELKGYHRCFFKGLCKVFGSISSVNLPYFLVNYQRHIKESEMFQDDQVVSLVDSPQFLSNLYQFDGFNSIVALVNSPQFLVNLYKFGGYNVIKAHFSFFKDHSRFPVETKEIACLLFDKAVINRGLLYSRDPTQLSWALSHSDEPNVRQFVNSLGEHLLDIGSCSLSVGRSLDIRASLPTLRSWFLAETGELIGVTSENRVIVYNISNQEEVYELEVPDKSYIRKVLGSPNGAFWVVNQQTNTSIFEGEKLVKTYDNNQGYECLSLSDFGTGAASRYLFQLKEDFKFVSIIMDGSSKMVNRGGDILALGIYEGPLKFFNVQDIFNLGSDKVNLVSDDCQIEPVSEITTAEGYWEVSCDHSFARVYDSKPNQEFLFKKGPTGGYEKFVISSSGILPVFSASGKCCVYLEKKDECFKMDGEQECESLCDCHNLVSFLDNGLGVFREDSGLVIKDITINTSEPRASPHDEIDPTFRYAAEAGVEFDSCDVRRYNRCNVSSSAVIVYDPQDPRSIQTGARESKTSWNSELGRLTELFSSKREGIKTYKGEAIEKWFQSVTMNKWLPYREFTLFETSSFREMDTPINFSILAIPSNAHVVAVGFGPFTIFFNIQSSEFRVEKLRLFNPVLSDCPIAVALASYDSSYDLSYDSSCDSLYDLSCDSSCDSLKLCSEMDILTIDGFATKWDSFSWLLYSEPMFMFYFQEHSIVVVVKRTESCFYHLNEKILTRVCKLNMTIVAASMFQESCFLCFNKEKEEIVLIHAAAHMKAEFVSGLTSELIEKEMTAKVGSFSGTGDEYKVIKTWPLPGRKDRCIIYDSSPSPTHHKFRISGDLINDWIPMDLYYDSRR